MEHFDVVIVGAGIAGGLAADSLARAGLKLVSDLPADGYDIHISLMDALRAIKAKGDELIDIYEGMIY